MKKISSKLIVLLVLSALIPMVTFGTISIWTSRRATYASVSQGNLNVAQRAAEQIELYVSNSIDVLKALAENINRADLKDWQKERIIKNYVINFEEFEQIYITDKEGRWLPPAWGWSRRIDPGNLPSRPQFPERFIAPRSLYPITWCPR